MFSDEGRRRGAARGRSTNIKPLQPEAPHACSIYTMSLDLGEGDRVAVRETMQVVVVDSIGMRGRISVSLDSEGDANALALRAPADGLRPW